MSTTDIAPYADGQVEGYGGMAVMTPEAAKALDEQVRLCTKAVLQEGVDYGVIPGTNGEKSLWRPGAQKLLQWFGLGYTCDRVEVERDDDGRKHGITYKCTVGRRLPDGSLDIKAACEGTADYDESKFYQPAEQVRARLRDNEHKWAAKDRRAPNADRWNSATEFRADWNALMQRAQKRAIVIAVRDATAAGGIFSEREEDDSPVPQDDGPAWYEQALEAVYAFTDEADGPRLYTAAAQAHRDGLCTRRQQDHIQNVARKRTEQLRTAPVVDVEDLARAAQDAAAEEPQDEPDGKPSPHAEMRRHFTRLGFGDSDEDTAARIRHIARITGRTVTPDKPLTDAEAQHVAGELAGCEDWDALDAMLNDGEKPGGDGDE